MSGLCKLRMVESVEELGSEFNAAFFSDPYRYHTQSSSLPTHSELSFSVNPPGPAPLSNPQSDASSKPCCTEHVLYVCLPIAKLTCRFTCAAFDPDDLAKLGSAVLAVDFKRRNVTGEKSSV